MMKRIVLLLLLSINCLASNNWAQTERLATLVATYPTVLHLDDVTQNPQYIQWVDGLELSGSSLIEKAYSFFSEHGTALGIKNPSDAFLLEKSHLDKAGNTHLKFQQFHNGIPFFGGQVQLHFNSRETLSAFNGVVFVDHPVSSPQISYFDAISSAMRFMSKTFPNDDLSHLFVQEAELQFYHQGLAMHKADKQILAYAVLISNQDNIREHIFVDAHSGQAIAHFPANCSLLHRRLYLENKNNQIWNEGESLPGVLDDWQQLQLQTTSQTYQFFANTFQYRSFDNLESEMQLIDQAAFLICPNASWNGSTVNLCQGIGSDDVIAHEWGHAYTEHTNNLLYAWEAGAINEAYSDIWGETIDLLNGDENQDELGNDCDDHIRWKIGEDANAISAPLRDMWNPNCNGHPGKISDTLYHCQTSDFGGVHTNSGIVNHAYALLVDGGSYNGFTIEGIGLTKAAHIFWHAQRYYLTRTSNFTALAYALEAACFDLNGHNLDRLSINNETNDLSNEFINASDSLQLHNVLLAVEMRLFPLQCDAFSTVLITPAPALCPQEETGFDPFFIETFEQGAQNWLMEELPGNEETWQSRNWALTDSLPDNRIGKAMYAPTPHIGDCDSDLNQGLIRLQSPSISIPSDIEGDIFLTFNHYFSLENGQDGGNLKVKRNGNQWLNISPVAFSHNGYNQYLVGSDNPLFTQKAFTGANQGSVAGSWGTSQIKLSILGVRPGDDIMIRWEVGTDGCDGWDGWYVDDILLASCSAAAALPVDFLFFNAKKLNKDVVLNWETTFEYNNKGFHVERSFDGHNFNTIGWVASHPSLAYQFIDIDPLEHQRTYYRLRQEDFDGKTSFSEIRVINFEGSQNWYIYPNPAKNQITVDFNNILSPTTISIYSIDGQLIQKSLIQNTREVLNITLSDLSTGLYLIQLNHNDKVSYQRLVIE